ncbi:glycosyltransferase family A protein [Paenibacillus sp. RC343]|uniref:glycosyltransferase n=1 Tax=Paenibacillus sp. RC343 TaxID=3045841 RepID=UPI0024B8D487|nr:glycosyltransferase family A protein [Paenibacillus sp. RC343]
MVFPLLHVPIVRNFFDNILQNYRRQRYKSKELIIILNNDSMNLQLYRNRVRGSAHVTVYQVPENISLGQCLNAGMTRARLSLVAKFDDDDYYSPFYLKEQVKELKRTKSDIVGKHSCLVYLSASKKLLIRSPKEANKHVEFVQGGTILFKKEVLKKGSFHRPLNRGGCNLFEAMQKKGIQNVCYISFQLCIPAETEQKEPYVESGRRFLYRREPIGSDNGSLPFDRRQRGLKKR